MNQNVFAQILEAKPALLAIETAFTNEFSFQGVDRMFGYHSTKSCLYVSPQVIVIKNYCSPKRPYPAKSYRIISAKFGMVDLYQETLTSELTKRDVRITVFPVPMAQRLREDLSTYRIPELNQLFEKIESEYGPACWSTNFSFYTEGPDAKCNRNDVVGADLWFQETQNLTADYKAWAEIIEALDAKFTNDKE